MANTNARRALRGAEKQIFDLMAETCTPEQWAIWLQASLAHAVQQGKAGLVQKLVNAGAEIGVVIHDAVMRGDQEVSKILLQNGPSVNATLDGLTPLHLAAAGGRTEIARWLLLKGAEIDAADTQGTTPLHFSIQRGHIATVKLLLASGADVTARQSELDLTPLDVAVGRGFIDITKALIEHGVNVNLACTLRGAPPLLYAAVKNSVEAIEILVEAGADIQANGVSGSTSLHAAAAELNFEATLALLKHGADVHALDIARRTPLHFAAQFAGDDRAGKVVDLLLRWNADETGENSYGRTPRDIVGLLDPETDSILANLERVSKLLQYAPEDRAWRRRGTLVLYRAHPERRGQASHVQESTVPRVTRSRTKLVESGQVAGGSVEGATADGKAAREWSNMAHRVLGLDEGIFRTIVGYL
ncbi:unnamed protein product [Ectocarpus fasciculatus]